MSKSTENRIAYHRTTAHRRLQELRRQPFDLAVMDDTVLRQRLKEYVCRSKHFDLFYWSERIDGRILDGLQQLADECALVEQFRQMKGGTVMNTIDGVESENRQVLHTACRDIFVEQPCQEEATDQAIRELGKLKIFLEEIENGTLSNEKGEPFTTLIHIGIGGSDLGPRSVYEALKIFGIHDRKVVFISNVDPDDAQAVLSAVDLSRSLVGIVSKSGTTLETLTNEELVREAFVSAGLTPANHFFAVTGKGSPMDNPELYLRSFYMFDYIGGRYSTSSMVGMTMLGFALGYRQIQQFLKGASTVDYEAEQEDVRANQPLLMALLGLWNHSYLQLPTVAVLPYSQALHRFPAHLQQCDMESNGKSVDRYAKPVDYLTGPVVWGEPGTNGQHAFYQLLHQGTEIVPCEFIGFRKSQFDRDIVIEDTSSQQKLVANLLAQSVALARGLRQQNPNRNFSGNRPNMVLLADRLTPETMGALLALYEAKIVYQGFAWNINSFDQEGVQLGKVLARRFLDEMASPEGAGTTLEREILESTGTL